MRRLFRIFTDRWRAESPRVYRWITNTATIVSGCAVAVSVALTAGGASVPSWWDNIYPYMIGIPAAIAFMSKMTKQDDNRQS